MRRGTSEVVLAGVGTVKPAASPAGSSSSNDNFMAFSWNDRQRRAMGANVKMRWLFSLIENEHEILCLLPTLWLPVLPSSSFVLHDSSVRVRCEVCSIRSDSGTPYDIYMLVPKPQITNYQYIGTLRCSANLYVVVPAILELISVLFLITIFPKYNRIH